jgi:ParB-like chromosome segregation protein Spo0J
VTALKFPRYKAALVADLIPYARNSRTHSDAQIGKIAASIKEFGFLNPVIIDGNNGIVAGHGRVLAAQKLGMAEVPVIEASHLTEAQRRAYVIADNRLALDAGWDEEMLRVEFEELEALGFDLELTGFSSFETDYTKTSESNDNLFETDDEVKEKKEPSKTDDGYAEFAIVLTVENKKRFTDALNIIKKDHGISSSEEALMVMCNEYLS